MKAKIRLDQFLVEQGHCTSRNQAQALIMAGQVFINDQPATKAGTAIDPAKSTIRLQEKLPYVSRGGLKLAKALSEFKIDVNGKTCLDIGASTGGFTDCLLQHCAKHVYAIDVGYGQLDWKLRNDPRVTVLEKTNIRHLTPDQLAAETLPTLAVIDVSFIGLGKVLPAVVKLLVPTASEIMALIKPQFEYKDQPNAQVTDFDGVIRDAEAHEAILIGVLQGIPAELGLKHLSFSPIQGPEGNIEFLGHWQIGAQSLDAVGLAKTVVRAAHAQFDSPR